MSQSTLGQEPELGLLRSKGDRPHLHIWAIALAGGVAAGLISWLAGELAHEAFKPQLFSVRIAFTTYIQPTADSMNVADRKNAILVFTILGGAMGLVMGFAGGLAGRSLSRGVLVGVAGLVSGGLVGFLASLALVPLFYQRYVPDPNDLLAPILIHGGIWVAIGAVGGMAFSVGMGRRERAPHAIGGACLGAIVASLVFHGISEAFFPDSGSTGPVATSILVRLLGAFVVSVLIAFGAARGVLGRIPRPRMPAAGQ
jgi:hypothetical protein